MDTQDNTQTNTQVIEGVVLEEKREGLPLAPLSIETPLSILEEEKQKKETEEEYIKRVKASEQTKYIETPKYKEWERLFLDKENPKTFGNQTMSAIVAYGLDPKTQYSTAGRMGHENAKKHKDLAKKYLQAAGFGYGQFIRAILKKAVTNKSNELLEYIRKIGEFEALPEIPVGGKEQAGSNTFNQYNFDGVNLDQLTDEQLTKYVESKQERLIAATSSSPAGTGTQDPGKSA